MGTSFKDQLLKAGIVNKKQVNKAQHETRANRKKGKGGGTPPPEINKTRQEQLEKEKRARELNQQMNREKLRLENLAQAKQLIETHRLKLEVYYEEPYYFTLGKKIKKLYVNEEIAKRLGLGQLEILMTGDRFDIVPAGVARQIVDRDPSVLLVLQKP